MNSHEVPDEVVLSGVHELRSNRFRVDGVERVGDQISLTVRLHSRAAGDMSFEPGDTRIYLIADSDHDRRAEPVTVMIPLPSSERINPYVWSRVATADDWFYLVRVSVEELLDGWRADESPRLVDHPDNMPEEDRVEIFFDVDWGWPWPLWEATGAMRPARYGLSAGLTRKLEAWVATWTAQVTEFGPWRDESAMPPWLIEGRRLAAELQKEVRDFADVRYTLV